MDQFSSVDNRLQLWLIISAVVIALIVYRLWTIRRAGVGLTVAYLIDLASVHWFGALIYTLPWYAPVSSFLYVSGIDRVNVEAGFLQCGYGILAFGVGALFLAPITFELAKPLFKKIKPFVPHPLLPQTYIATAIIFNMLLAPFLSKIPSLGQFCRSGWSLLSAGLALYCWDAWRKGRRASLFFGILLTVVSLPAFTMLAQGFLGYGVRAVIPVLVLVFVFYRPRWHILLMTGLAIFLGLSLFVNYFTVRGSLREQVWGESSVIGGARVIVDQFKDFEWFNFRSQEHLEAIDMRLNQNALVGKAIDYVGNQSENYAHGSTFSDALLQLVPRIIWPSKPIYGGSGDLVASYTGMEFAEGTSVGIGQVMEFYINFSTLGVVVGFLIFGTAIGFIDRHCAARLTQGDWKGFVLWYVPGLGFINATGSVDETIGAIWVNFIFCIIINQFILGHREAVEVRKSGLNAR